MILNVDYMRYKTADSRAKILMCNCNDIPTDYLAISIQLGDGGCPGKV